MRNFFNVKLVTKNGTYEIKNNELYLNGKDGYVTINAKDANALIQLTYDAAKHFVVTSTCFSETIKDIIYLVETKEFLVNLKSRNCHDTLYKFSETNSAFFQEKINKVREQHLSIPEKFVFAIAQNYKSNLEYILDENDILKNSKQKIAELKKEYLSYPYKKYVECDDQIISEIKKKFELAKEILTAFENFKEEAGDDLINWTQHKVSRRLKNHNIRYYVWNLVEKYQKELNKKGVKAIDKKKAKAKIELDHAENDDDFVRCFKSGPVGNTWNAFESISFQRKLELIQEDTKIVTEKIKGEWTRFLDIFEKELQPSKECIDSMLVLVSRINQKDSDRYSNKYQVTWDFFNKNIEHLSYSKFLEFQPFVRNISGEVTNETFDKLIKRFPKEHQLTYSSEISKHFITRMTNPEKIEVLNNYNNISLSSSLMREVFASVPVETLRKFIVKNPKHTKHLLNLLKDSLHFKREVLTNLDMLHDLVSEHSEDAESQSFFKTLDKVEKFNAILNWYEHKQSYSQQSVLKILDKKQLEELYLQEIVKNSYSLTQDILEKYSDKKATTKTLIQRALNLGKTLFIAIDDKVIESVDLVMRIELLEHNTAISSESNVLQYYPEKIKDTVTYNFLKDIPRDALEENDWISGYTLYIADRLSTEELLRHCRASKDFVRANLEHVPKSFLNDIKNDKEYIKKLIGDCRDRTNKSFANYFQEISKIPNCLEFILNIAS